MQELPNLVEKQPLRNLKTCLKWKLDEPRRAGEQGRQKLATMRDKIGYPDQWRGYSPIHVERGDHFGNVARATMVDLKRQMDRSGRPVARDEW